jgi:hypothetical protein
MFFLLYACLFVVMIGLTERLPFNNAFAIWFATRVVRWRSRGLMKLAVSWQHARLESGDWGGLVCRLLANAEKWDTRESGDGSWVMWVGWRFWCFRLSSRSFWQVLSTWSSLEDLVNLQVTNSTHAPYCQSLKRITKLSYFTLMNRDVRIVKREARIKTASR